MDRRNKIATSERPVIHARTETGWDLFRSLPLFRWAAQLPRTDRIPLFYVCLSFAVFFLTLPTMPYSYGLVGWSRAEAEFNTYMIGWTLVPALSLAASLALFHAKNRCVDSWASFAPQHAGDPGSLTPDDLFGPALVLCSSAFWALAIALRALTHSTSLYLGAVACLFPTILCLGAAIACALRRSSPRFRNAIHSVACNCVPLLAFVAVYYFTEIPIGKDSQLVMVLLAATLTTWATIHLGQTSFLSQRYRLWWGDILVGALLFLVVFGFFPVDLFHQSHFLAPISDLRNGRTLLVDTSCLYGVLSIYFLHGLFRLGITPYSYEALAFWVTILTIIQYLTIYALLRYVLRCRWLSVLALGSMVVFNYFSIFGFFAQYPSIGPLRFGIPWLLAFVLMLRFRSRQRWRPAFLGLEGILLAIASVWSVETFLYAFVSYAALVTYEVLNESGDWKRLLRVAGRRAGTIAAFIVTAHALLIMYTYWRSGRLPDWSVYLEYVYIHGLTKSFGEPIPFGGIWIVVVLALFVSLMLLAFHVLLIRRPLTTRAKVVLFVTVLGVIEFSSYVSNSEPNHLFAVCIPAIFVSFYWVAWFARRRTVIPAWHPFTVAWCCFALLFALLAAQEREVYRKWGAMLLFAPEKRLLPPAVTDTGEPRVTEICELIRKYAPHKPRVGLFTSNDEDHCTTQVMVRLDKAHVFPIFEPRQADTLPDYYARFIEHSDPGLKPGDVIFVEQNELNGVVKKALDRLRREYGFELLETSPNQVAAIRLVAK
jgi:hypothetical protein